MRLTASVLALLIVGTVLGQSSSEYLKLRSDYHITQSLGARALDAFKGTKTVELQGTVRGSFQSGSTISLMFDVSGGDTLVVESNHVPDWLVGNETPVRLLVRVNRDAEGTPLKATLVSAAREDDVKRVEDAYWKHEAEKRRSTVTQRSRVNRRSVLFGPIGRGNLASRHATRARRDRVLPSSDVTPIYASFVRGRNPRLSKAKALEIARSIVGYSLSYGVEPRLVMAMIMVESDFDPNSTSHSGAMGLGQLMPETARWMGVSNAYDTTENVYGMVKLIRTHLDQYTAQTGDMNSALPLALAAYNAGEGAVRRAGGVPNYRETQAYVARVIAIYQQLCGRA